MPQTCAEWLQDTPIQLKMTTEIIFAALTYIHPSPLPLQLTVELKMQILTLVPTVRHPQGPLPAPSWPLLPRFFHVLVFSRFDWLMGDDCYG